MKNRIIALVLALLMLLSLAACAGKTTPEDTVVTTAGADTAQSNNDEPEETKDPTLDDEGYKLDDLGDKLDFGAEEVKILYWSDAERHEFEMEPEDLNGSIVDQAIFNRNERTQQRLNVKFVWDKTDGNNTNRNKFVSYVENQQAAGDYYDIISSYSRTIGLLTGKGLLKNLNAIEGSHLNFDQPWWPAKLLDTCKIGNGLFFCSGDISTNVLHFMYVIWYNMDLLGDLNLENPIELVDNHQWTMEKLMSMSKDLYIDRDQDGKKNDADRYGFTTVNYGLDAFYTGSGLRLISPDKDNLLKISDDFTGKKAVDLVDTLGTWLNTPDCFITSDTQGDVDVYTIPFVNGDALFCQNRVYIADNEDPCRLCDVTWNYGVLPTPLYNTDQERYITLLGNPVSLWSIQTDVKDDAAVRNTAVIECLASYAFRLTTPALFENNMKYKYTNGAETDGIRMFDIVRSGIDFDLGRIFASSLENMSEKPSVAAEKGQSWATQGPTVTKQITKNLKNSIIEPLKKILDQ